WQPPQFGWLKCNVDAGFHDHGLVTNRGWCIRNDAGLFVCAGTAWDKGAHSITEAEALALMEAMQS
ncbi:putative ribonuclease H protein, partial [Trifolium medium]|nr:putative ribonuclease H protein [Trifolium medium]